MMLAVILQEVEEEAQANIEQLKEESCLLVCILP
jgi:hypothetical protein